MSETVRCTACGTELSPDASPQGLCASCLLKLGLSSTNIPPASALDRESVPRTSNRKTYLAIAAAVLAIAGIAMLGLSLRRPPSTPTAVLRFNLTLPNAEDFAVSPDGRRVAFTATDEAGKRLLWIHAMDSFADIALAQTEEAAAPFWSPDSRFVGFFARGKLRKVDIGNGASEVLCDAPKGRSGAWSSTGVIVFERNTSGPLFRVSDRGGTVSPVTKNPRPEHSDVAHRWPHFLPDGDHFVYTSLANNDEDAGIFVSSVETGEVKRLFNDRSQAVYAAESLLFVRSGILLSQPFDFRRIEATGDARAIAFAENVDRFSTSAGDMLAYRQSVERPRSPLVWIDRQGKIAGPIEGLSGVDQFSISPDGRRVAASRSGDIWVAEMDRGVVLRFTFDPAQDTFPIWSPDGTRIVFASNRAGRKGLYQKATNSSTGEELLIAVPQLASVDSWSADGKFILYTSVDEKGKSAVWMLPTEGDRKPSMIPAAFSRSEPRLSPDTRWMGYVSDESGSDEVYVEAFPPGGAKWQVSPNGGANPAWSKDGREMYYVSKDRLLMSVAIGADGRALNISSPRPLFGVVQGRYEVSRSFFLMPSTLESQPPAPIHVVVNWPNEIRRQ